MIKLTHSLVPVGTRARPVTALLLAGYITAAVISFGSYLYEFDRMYSNLYFFRDGEMVRRENYQMLQFRYIKEDSFDAFLIFLLCLAALAAYNYFSHFIGSKSIYTMLRVGRGELIKRCVSLPLIFAAAVLLTMTVFNLLWFGWYIFKVPEDALRPDYADGLWRFFL